MTRGLFIPHSSYFFSSLLLLLLLLFLHLLSTTAREWHIANLYMSVDKPKRLPLVIYPKFNQCTNEDDLRMQLDWTSEEGNWSSILNQYLFYMANIPDSHGEELMVDVFATFRYVVLIGPIFFFLCYFLFTALALLLTIPFGAILFFIFGPIFFLVGKLTYYIGRHLLICFESCSRRKERVVMPRSMRKMKTSYRPRNFRLPYFFRKTSDEQFHKQGWASSENENENYNGNNDNNSDSSDEEEKQLVEELERKVRLRAFSTSLTIFRKSFEKNEVNQNKSKSKSKSWSNQIHPQPEPKQAQASAPEEFQILFDESGKEKPKFKSNEIDLDFNTLADETETDDEMKEKENNEKLKEKSLSIIFAPQTGKRVPSFTERKDSQSKNVNQDGHGRRHSRSHSRSQSKRRSKRGKKKHHVVGTQTTMESQFLHEDTFVHLPPTTASTTGGFRNHKHHHQHPAHGHRVKGRPHAGALGRTKRRKSHGLDPDVRETKVNLNPHHHVRGKRKSQVSRSSVGMGQSQRQEQIQIPQIRIYSAQNTNITNTVPSRSTTDNEKDLSRNVSPFRVIPTETGTGENKKKKHRKKTTRKKMMMMMRTPSNMSGTAHVKPRKKRKIRKKDGNPG